MSQYTIAYFINQYPKVSHSFIRREILALENQGIKVKRFALRGWDADLVDAEDDLERERTRYVLQNGVLGLFFPVIQALLRSPAKFFSSLQFALRMGKHNDRAWPYHLVYFAEACRLLHWVHGDSVRHIHAHFGTNSTEVVMLLKLLGGPSYSFTVHGPEEFDKPEFIKLREKVCHSAFVVAISSFGRSQIFRWIAYEDWEKVKLVHCGLEDSFYKGVMQTIPMAPRLVCVGRLCEQKGQLLLLEACHKLAEKDIDFELVLAGDGEMRPQLETVIKQHSLGNKVRITGWISSEQVRAEILSSRVLVLPSFAEGLPVVIMEAMALHRPVLATYIAGIPELIRHGENGWLFPAGDVDELVFSLEEALLTPIKTLEKMGKAAHQRVVERHSVEVEAAKLASLFIQEIAD